MCVSKLKVPLQVHRAASTCFGVDSQDREACLVFFLAAFMAGGNVGDEIERMLSCDFVSARTSLLSPIAFFQRFLRTVQVNRPARPFLAS